MALQLLYEKTDTGDTYPEAYYRLTQVNINNGAAGAELVIAIFRDMTARDEGKHSVAVFTIGIVGDEYTQYFSPIPLSSVNPFAQGYTYMKTLPEYEGALDV